MSDFNRGTRRFDDVESDTLDTGSITDSDDGQAWETLREVGYEKNDRLAFYGQHLQATTQFSTSSDTFERNQGVGGIGLIDLSVFPSDVTVYFKTIFQTWDKMEADGEYVSKLADLPGDPKTPIKTVASGDKFKTVETGTIEVTERKVTEVYHFARSEGSNTITYANVQPIAEVEI